MGVRGLVKIGVTTRHTILVAHPVENFRNQMHPISYPHLVQCSRTCIGSKEKHC